MINGSLCEWHLLVSHENAVVMPVLKKTSLDVLDLENYRPLSNLSFVSKLVKTGSWLCRGQWAYTKVTVSQSTGDKFNWDRCAAGLVRFIDSNVQPAGHCPSITAPECSLHYSHLTCTEHFQAGIKDISLLNRPMPLRLFMWFWHLINFQTYLPTYLLLPKTLLY